MDQMDSRHAYDLAGRIIGFAMKVHSNPGMKRTSEVDLHAHFDHSVNSVQNP
jgi:hypothetical protein